MTDPALLHDIDEAIVDCRLYLTARHDAGLLRTVDVLARCRTTIIQHEGVWSDFPPPLASDGPCAAGWVDREGDVQS
jgi:hypothetical protein